MMQIGFTRPMLLVALVAGAIGVWAGFSFWQSDTVMTNIHAGLAVLVGANLLFCSWIWSRAKPGSGDAMVLPTFMFVLAAMLIGILPRLFWPSTDGIHMVGSIASTVIVIVIAVMQIRKRRRLRHEAKPV
jgi:uncharacterized membrane protein YoaK (UPF0700 family)